jgi:hypothetical protein
MKLLLALTAPLLFVAPLSAADADWNNLRSLKQGDKIEIVQTDRTRVAGRFSGFTDSGISIESAGSASIPKERVAQVDRLGKGRAFRAVIGAVAGVAAGLILNATVGERFRNEGSNVNAGAMVGGGAVVGAGIGALTGSGRHTV